MLAKKNVNSRNSVWNCQYLIEFGNSGLYLFKLYAILALSLLNISHNIVCLMFAFLFVFQLRCLIFEIRDFIKCLESYL